MTDRDNPRWNRWPFCGMRENTAAMLIGGLAWLALAALSAWVFVTLLHGCYLAYEADGRADSGVMPMAGGTAVNGLRSRDGGSNPPTPTNCEGGVIVAYYGCTRPGDAFWQKYCEGPVRGCIAPGSPQSSHPVPRPP